jgi:hypothetical protein
MLFSTVFPYLLSVESELLCIAWNLCISKGPHILNHISTKKGALEY